MLRSDEECRIAETDVPVGLVNFRRKFAVAKIDAIVIHPFHQGQGLGSELMRELHKLLTSEGVVVAEFDALPGVIADMTLRGRFEAVGEALGERSGLPLVMGRVQADNPYLAGKGD
jgi:GNAT superfamily N-acetyltransferase